MKVNGASGDAGLNHGKALGINEGFETYNKDNISQSCYQ